MLIELQHIIKEKKYENIIRMSKNIFPPKIIDNLVFRKNFGRWINYKEPELLDEKLLILSGSTYYKNELISRCADKVEVRNYIKQNNLESILINVIGIYKSVSDIKWEQLPKKFVIKCNHGSGYNIIVRDIHKEDINKIKSQLEYWMKENYAIKTAERQYSNIPRRIIIEELLDTKTDELPIDYKFFCSRGKIICTLVFTGRGNKVERLFVDDKYEDLRLVNEYSKNNYKTTKPESYNEMLKIASVLSKEFPFVRVDLYDVDGKPYFGELTFTPSGNYHYYLPEKSQRWIGERIDL